MHKTFKAGVGGALTALSLATVMSYGDVVSAFITTNFPYAISLTTEYTLKPILSVGDRVPETSDPTKEFQMVGIPDGLGAHASGRDRVTVYLNHELGNTVLSEPVIGDPLNRGALVSKLTLDRDGNVLSGERAYDTVYVNDTLVGPAATVTNTTPAFGRFCSGFLAGPQHGFDRYIYFANEESGAPSTFDGRGGLSVAIFDNEAHALPYLGRFPWENTLVQPNTGRLTVVMGMEDGPSALDPAVENSQLYMYVGHKSRKPGATVLERNGLVGGKLYVFRSKDASKNSELPFQTGTLEGEWVHIPDAHLLSQAQLEAASDAAGAMTFARPEDGAFNPRNRDEYFFVTTGEAAGANVLGRLYSLRLNAGDPTETARLEVLYNADQVIAAGGDTALSPDNIDVSQHFLMINEDGTSSSRQAMTTLNRDGSIWRFNLSGYQGVDVSSAARIVELDTPGADGIAVPTPGTWETSGIIDTTHLFKAAGPARGQESWLFDVQAHRPTTAPESNTVEDGQLLMLICTHR